MRRPFPALPAALAAAALGGCVRVVSSPLTPGAAYPPVPADSVRVFVTQAPPAYTEVALLRAVGGFPPSDAKSLRALRKRAGRLGANGLLLLPTRTVTPGQAGGAEVGTDDTERAVAIRYSVAPAGAGPGGAARP